jgi:hypothetical protein
MCSIRIADWWGVFFGEEEASVNGMFADCPCAALWGLPKTPHVLQWTKRSSRAWIAYASRFREPSTFTQRRRSSEAL